MVSRKCEGQLVSLKELTDLFGCAEFFIMKVVAAGGRPAPDTTIDGRPAWRAATIDLAYQQAPSP
jgi:hypothetical protein